MYGYCSSEGNLAFIAAHARLVCPLCWVEIRWAVRPNLFSHDTTGSPYALS